MWQGRAQSCSGQSCLGRGGSSITDPRGALGTRWQMSAGSQPPGPPAREPRQKLLLKVVFRFFCILLVAMTSPGWNACVPPTFNLQPSLPLLCPWSNYSLTTGDLRSVTKRLQTLLPASLGPKGTRGAVRGAGVVVPAVLRSLDQQMQRESYGGFQSPVPSFIETETKVNLPKVTRLVPD